MNTSAQMSPTEQRAYLAAELEAVETHLADLEAERKRIEPKPDSAGLIFASANPRLSEVLGLLSTLDSRVYTLKDQLPQLDKVISHNVRLAGAVDEALVARTAMDAAEARAISLDEQVANLGARLATLRTQVDDAEAETARAEEQANRDYSRAVAVGDAKAEKTASTRLQAVQDESVKAAITARQRRGLIASMEAEMGELATLAESARSEATEAKRRMLSAIGTRLRAEFDVVMSDMLGLLARIAWADRGAGLSPTYWLSKVSLPRFAPGGLDWAVGRDVDRLAADLRLDDLLADLDTLAENAEEVGQ